MKDDFKCNKLERDALGFYIKRRRRMLDMSTKTIANLLGIDSEYIRSLEKGKISIINPKVLIKLSDILDIHYLMLFTLVGYIDSRDLTRFFARDNSHLNLTMQSVWDCDA